MVFSSLLFLFGFLPIFLLCYYFIPGRWKNSVALFGSYFFYAWGEPVFAIILFGSSIIDYLLSRVLGKLPTNDSLRRHSILLLSVLLNIGFGFVNTALDALENYPESAEQQVSQTEQPQATMTR
jgi:alginate O-acetyltransferase complex protein AlgI